jgi:hypothetical protein
VIRDTSRTTTPAHAELQGGCQPSDDIAKITKIELALVFVRPAGRPMML